MIKRIYYKLKKIYYKFRYNIDIDDMSHMFSNCGRLTSLDVSNFDTSRVINMSHMFDNIKLERKEDFHYIEDWYKNRGENNE